MNSATITTGQLETLSGLSRRRLTQLATDGKIPKPVAGRWEAAKTIRGLFAYYQAATENAETLTKQRIRVERAKADKLETQNRLAAGEVVSRAAIIAAAGPAIQAIRDALYAKIGHELATSVAGLGIPETRIVANRFCDELLLRWQEVFRQWGV